jgi:hypothetical protein
MAYSYNRSFILEFLKKINMIENLNRLLLTACWAENDAAQMLFSFVLDDRFKRDGGTLLLG